MRNDTTETTRDNAEPSGGREQAGGVTSKSHAVAEQARAVVMDRVDSVRQSTQSAKQQAADKLRKLGATVRKVGEHMQVEDQTYIAQKAGTASERLETFANYVDAAEISGLLNDTRRLARGNAAAFFGTAAVVGLAAGRCLKVLTGHPATSMGERPKKERRRDSGSTEHVPQQTAANSKIDTQAIEEGSHATATHV